MRTLDRLVAIGGLVAEALELADELPHSEHIRQNLTEVRADIEFIIANLAGAQP